MPIQQSRGSVTHTVGYCPNQSHKKIERLKYSRRANSFLQGALIPLRQLRGFISKVICPFASHMLSSPFQSYFVDLVLCPFLPYMKLISMIYYNIQIIIIKNNEVHSQVITLRHTRILVSICPLILYHYLFTCNTK